MFQCRRSGILLHPTCLPSRFGLGDFGPEADRFLSFLEAAGQTVWQVLPLGITDGALGYSPYSSLSSYAGNPHFISPELLCRDGLLEEWDLDLKARDLALGCADYAGGRHIRDFLLDRAFVRFFEEGRGDMEIFLTFRRREAHWVEDFALFMALREMQGRCSWHLWPAPLRDRERAALNECRQRLEREIARHIFHQFLFFQQWDRLKERARERGISLFGDLPIYVSFDSADVWSHPRQFQLGGSGRPRKVAGVPPDYFSSQGQLWGNPLYNWQRMNREGFSWWIKRLRHALRLFDQVRIDHFRGLLQYWSVPAGAETAKSGQWEDVPSGAFFKVLREAFPALPFVAENLGVITADVEKAMEELGLPGMRVLLFAFGNDVGRNPYAPHNHSRNDVVYTGTHDNNTVRGWWEDEADEGMKQRFKSYLGYDPGFEGIAGAFVRMALSSVARLAVIPLQDVLSLGARARMNRPSVADGNWKWRLERAEDYERCTERLSDLVGLYGRRFGTDGR